MVIKSERLPAPGETIIGGTFLMNPGGKGANQAVAVARLGGNVSFVANLGNVLFGSQALEHFQEENINTDFVLLDEAEPSGVALINVDAKGENTIVVASGSNGNLTSQKLESFFKSLKSNAIVLIQFEIPLTTVEFIIQQCATKSIRVIVNPAPANKIHEMLWKHVFAVTPNESEAELITGIKIDDENSIQAAAKNLLDKGVQHVIITLGKRGAYWCNKDSNGFVSAPKVNAVDTTAAGDCFNGAFAVAIAEGMSIHDAVSLACEAASISVTLMGAQASMPYRSEII
jgi:ribokinase